MNTNRIRSLLAMLAFVASLLYTSVAVAQKGGDDDWDSEYPTVPSSVAFHGRASVMSFFTPQFARVSLSANGKSVIGDQDGRRWQNLDAAELQRLGYAGTFETFQKAIMASPFKGLEIVPIEGNYEVYVSIYCYVEGYNQPIMSGSAWLEIVEDEDGNPKVVSSKTHLNLAFDRVRVADAGIEAAVWVSPDYVARSQYFYANGRGFVTLPIGILNNGTLVAEINSNGSRHSVAITLGESSTTVTNGRQITFALGRIQSPSAVVQPDLTVPVPNVQFYFDRDSGVIRGEYPMVEHTPTTIGAPTVFALGVRLWNSNSNESVQPKSVLVKNMGTGEEETIWPDINGKFTFNFKAYTYHLIADFDQVYDWSLEIERFRG